MAAGTVSWKGLTLSAAVRLRGRRVVRESATFSSPGIHGVEKIDKGFRARIMPYLGEIAAADMAALDAAIVLWEDQVGNGVASFSEAGSYDNVELSDFQVLGRGLGTGGRRALVSAVFTQIRPNADEFGSEDF